MDLYVVCVSSNIFIKIPICQMTQNSYYMPFTYWSELPIWWKNIEPNIQHALTAHHVPALLLCHEICCLP